MTTHDDAAPQNPNAAAIAEEGAPYRTGTSFNPAPYVRQLRGRGGGAQDYLDVKWRLLWLRREHPDAEILTEHVVINEQQAIFKALVALPSGGKATGYGSETRGDFADFIEKAETKAIGRALNALGYGAHFAEGDEEAGETTGAETLTVPAAVPPSAPTPRQPPRPAAIREAASPVAQATPATPATGSAPLRQPARPAARPAAGPAVEAELADYSWSAFWRWAKGIGLNDKPAVEAYLGIPFGNLTPREVRARIEEKQAPGL